MYLDTEILHGLRGSSHVLCVVRSILGIDLCRVIQSRNSTLLSSFLIILHHGAWWEVIRH